MLAALPKRTMVTYCSLSHDSCLDIAVLAMGLQRAAPPADVTTVIWALVATALKARSHRPHTG